MGNSFKEGVHAIFKKELSLSKSLAFCQLLADVLEELMIEKKEHQFLTAYQLYKELYLRRKGTCHFGQISEMKTEGLPIFNRKESNCLLLDKTGDSSKDFIFYAKLENSILSLYNNFELKNTLELKVRNFVNLKSLQYVPKDVNTFFDLSDKGSVVKMKAIFKLFNKGEKLKILFEGVSGIGKVQKE